MALLSRTCFTPGRRTFRPGSVFRPLDPEGDTGRHLLDVAPEQVVTRQDAGGMRWEINPHYERHDLPPPPELSPPSPSQLDNGPGGTPSGAYERIELDPTPYEDVSLDPAVRQSPPAPQLDVDQGMATWTTSGGSELDTATGRTSRGDYADSVADGTTLGEDSGHVVSTDTQVVIDAMPDQRSGSSPAPDLTPEDARVPPVDRERHPSFLHAVDAVDRESSFRLSDLYTDEEYAYGDGWGLVPDADQVPPGNGGGSPILGAMDREPVGFHIAYGNPENLRVDGELVTTRVGDRYVTTGGDVMLVEDVHFWNRHRTVDADEFQVVIKTLEPPPEVPVEAGDIIDDVVRHSVPSTDIWDALDADMHRFGDTDRWPSKAIPPLSARRSSPARPSTLPMPCWSSGASSWRFSRSRA